MSNDTNDPPSSSRADRFPWLLAAGPAIVVVASLVTFAIAVRSDDGLVAKNYYKLGLTINRTLAAVPTHLARGEATISIGIHGDVRVRLDGMDPASLAIDVRAPAQHDAAKVALHRTGAGEWAGLLPAIAPGRNIVTLAAEGWQLPVTLVERVPSTVRVRGEATPR